MKEAVVSFQGAYRGRRVFVTGDTGFKGSWLASWLVKEGATVIGFSNGPLTEPNGYDAHRLADRIRHIDGDVRDAASVAAAIRATEPELVFHLAAQAIVGIGFANPVETFETNVMGTVNVLEACARSDSVRGALFITTDKCYANNGWSWGYREIDPLGGDDPYGGSKAAAELAVSAYRRTVDHRDARGGPMGIASARAGNVIGGGDWSPDRLIPDIVRALVSGRELRLRRSDATRPWLHVLEPLSGYLMVGARLLQGDPCASTSWNFGPRAAQSQTVRTVAERFVREWGRSSGPITFGSDPQAFPEASILRLDSSKAGSVLGWESVWSVERCLQMTADWYRAYYERSAPDMFDLTIAQIEKYESDAAAGGSGWAPDGSP
ncbi:CDP-glucose 4,6-dehydratase [Actinomadura vinacea]|uniref:CDP-glucose 4,6-dehydratase n=1 Tax=Actinomadura vinacea TaxID=115336 RepID=A0ABN3IHN4_9ACTN